MDRRGGRGGPAVGFRVWSGKFGIGGGDGLVGPKRAVSPPVGDEVWGGEGIVETVAAQAVLRSQNLSRHGEEEREGGRERE